MEEQPELEAWRASDQLDGKYLAARVFHGFRGLTPGFHEVFAVAVADDKYSVKVAIDLETLPGLPYELYGTRLTITRNQYHIGPIDAVHLAEPAYVIWLRLLALADDENCRQACTRSFLAD